MTEKREWLGDWIVFSEKPERVFQGILTFTPSIGGELTISNGASYWDEFNLLDQSKLIPIIKGYDNHSGKNITLVNSIIVNYSISNGIRVKIYPNLIIENLEYKDQSSLQFLTASVVYSGLSPWLSITGINKILKDDGRNFTGIHMEYKQPESLKFDIDRRFKIQIDFGYSPGSDPRSYTGYELKETCYTSFIFEKPGFKLEDILKWVEHYRRLFTTLFGQSCFITYFRLTDSPSITLTNNYNIFYRNTIDGFPDRSPSLVRMRTLYKYLTSPLGDILDKWASYHQSNDLDYVAWISSKNFSQFSEETFLEVARSLEVLYSAIRDNSLYSQEEKTKLKDAIAFKLNAKDLLGENFEEEGIERFENIVEKILTSVDYSDVWSFRKKIKFALAEIKEKLTSESFDKLFSDSKNLPEIIVNNRNYYTHYDKESSKRIKTEELTINELVLLSRKVKNIMLLIFFDDFGIDMQMIANSLIRLEVS